MKRRDGYMDSVVRRKQLWELIGVSAVVQWRMERAKLHGRFTVQEAEGHFVGFA